jgi:hypothetical protein
VAKSKSISDLIMEYFQMYPKEDLQHGPVVDWVEEQYLNLFDKKPRDTWRAIRKLYQEGKLIKVRKGVYRYDPDYDGEVSLADFSPEVKKAIFKHDKFKCVFCGRGEKDGVELCADHIKPKDKGGDNSIDNGQTLCAEHNLMKKNYSQSEAGKKYFIKMYRQAVAKKDKKVIDFCKELFNVYDQYKINGHIKRPNGYTTARKAKS